MYIYFAEIDFRLPFVDKRVQKKGLEDDKELHWLIFIAVSLWASDVANLEKMPEGLNQMPDLGRHEQLV